MDRKRKTIRPGRAAQADLIAESTKRLTKGDTLLTMKTVPAGEQFDFAFPIRLAAKSWKKFKESAGQQQRRSLCGATPQQRWAVALYPAYD